MRSAGERASERLGECVIIGVHEETTKKKRTTEKTVVCCREIG